MAKIAIIVMIVALLGLFFYRTLGNRKVAEENIAIGDRFLIENANKEGVVAAPAGFQYLILHAGTGTENPKATDKVRVHYHGTLIDGTVFDSSVDRGEPIEFGLNQVIKGWTLGVTQMVEGEKRRLYLPSALAYGNRGIGKIPAGSLLIFDVELLQINP